MQIQVQHHRVNVFDDALVSGWGPRVRTVVEFLRSRALELTVGTLVVLWWLQVFSLWVQFLQQAASLGAPPS